MKKLIVLGIVLTMVMGLAAVANASATDWILCFKATDQNGSNSTAGTNYYGIMTGASDGAAGEDVNVVAGTGKGVVLSCFDLGSGSNNNGYSGDIRASDTTNLTWNLKLWGQDSCTATQYKVIAWVQSGYALPEGQTMNLSVTGDSTKSYTFDSTASTSSKTPVFTWYFDAGSEYDLTLGAVPEPGSMVAMLSGLVGLVGFGIRRRK